MMFRNRLATFAAAILLSGGLAACDDEEGGTTTVVPPSAVTATQNGSDVVITWTAPAGSSLTYTVQRQDNGEGAFAALASNVAATTYTDEDVDAGVYAYRVIASNGSTTSAASDVDVVTVGARRATFSGTVATGTTRLLSADTLYTLTGPVVVDSGAVLRIQPGTEIQGNADVRGTALFIRRGAQIFAEGTADAPIVFTSSLAPAQRTRGDWGGVIINGRSLCNFPAPCQGEGDSGTYGGNVLNDNSGVLTYVRIEFAGLEISQDNELNGLTLNGVGSGTTIHHVQVHYGDDDGIEWFGGTVNVKYALVTGAEDDSFDFSTGWQGMGQFWIAQQDPAAGDRGFEVDGNEDDFTATPLTAPTIYNVTLIGGGPDGAAGESPDGMHLRRGYGGKIFNAIVMGFADGVDVDDAQTVLNCESGAMVLANSIFHQVGELYDSDDDTAEATCAAEPTWAAIRTTDPGLVAPYNRSAPDFRPATGSAATTGFAAVPDNGFFDAVDFVGGVAPGGTPWYSGWTTTAIPGS